MASKQSQKEEKKQKRPYKKKEEKENKIIKIETQVETTEETQPEFKKKDPREIVKALQKLSTQNESKRAKHRAANVLPAEIYIASESPPINYITTGIKALDLLLGGGFPAGRISLLFGPFESGKSSLCLTMVAANQKRGLTTLWIDAENKFQVEFAKRLGVDPELLVVQKPKTLNDVMQDITDLLKPERIEGRPDIIVVDSIAALAENQKFEKESWGDTMMVNAKEIAEALTILMPFLAATETAIIFINQLRIPKAANPYARPEEDFPGGNALKHATTLQIKIKETTSTLEKLDFSVTPSNYRGSRAIMKTDQSHGRSEEMTFGDEELKPEIWWYWHFDKNSSNITVVESITSLRNAGCFNGLFVPIKEGSRIKTSYNGNIISKEEILDIAMKSNPVIDLKSKVLGEENV